MRMKFDTLGLLITNDSAPGCYGDSCAETSRYFILTSVMCKLDITSYLDYNRLVLFMTPNGILRHPMSPWREDDTSQDQKLPLFLSLDAVNSHLLYYYKHLDPWWRLKRFVGIKTVVQAMLFKFPWRWNDGLKAFERSSGSSADYLNFIIQLVYAKSTNRENLLTRLALKLVSASVAMQKVDSYYSNDLANNKWLISLYEDAIRETWRLD